MNHGAIAGDGSPPRSQPPEDSRWSGTPRGGRTDVGVGPEAAGRTEVSAPADQVHVSGGRRRQGRPGLRRMGIPDSWPLLIVLLVQAALSLRLVRADTAFQDEATYLWTGHLEWANEPPCSGCSSTDRIPLTHGVLVCYN